MTLSMRYRKKTLIQPIGGFMFNPSISLIGDFPRVTIDTPIRPTQSPTNTIAQKIKAAIVHIFQVIADFFQNLLFTSTTKTHDDLQPEVATDVYKLTYRLPMLGQPSQNEANQTPYVILTLDGGGVRGKASLAALKEIELEIDGRIIDAVDCIAGVSTGGIIAAALALPSVDDLNLPRYSAEDVDDLYDNFAETIFSNSIYRKISSLFGAIDSKYPSPRAVLESIISGDMPLSASLAKKLIITSVDLLSGNTIFFDNGEEDDAEIFEEHGLKFSRASSNDATFGDAVEATSAAPTYFPTKVFKNYNLMDGGMATNNPAQIATLLAIKEVAKDRPILVISIGTGKMPSEPVTSKGSLHWGWVQWVLPLFDYFCDINAQQADLQMKLMAENNPLINYVRFQIILENASEAELDNASPENMQRLGELGTRAFRHFLDNGGRESVIDPLRQKLAVAHLS